MDGFFSNETFNTNPGRIEIAFAFHDEQIIGAWLERDHVHLGTRHTRVSNRTLFLFGEVNLQAYQRPVALRLEKAGGDMFKCVHALIIELAATMCRSFKGTVALNNFSLRVAAS